MIELLDFSGPYGNYILAIVILAILALISYVIWSLVTKGKINAGAGSDLNTASKTV